jgi:hypothetical protein
MIWKRRIWLTLLLALALPAGAIAQQVMVTPKGGWIGITIDFVTSYVSEAQRTVVLIREVVEGSPAMAAGIQVGDTVTHLDGRPISQKLFSALTRSLEPGDLVPMTLNREGQTREVVVETGPWPARVTIQNPDVGEWEIKLDSVRGAILQNLDSLRLSFTGLRLDTLGAMSLEILRVPPPLDQSGQIGFVFQWQESFFDTLAVMPEVFTLAPEAALPFDAYLIQSEATDSLKEDLRQVRKALTEVRRRELTRLSELQGVSRGQVGELVRSDELIQKLREEEEALVQEHELLNERIQRLSQEEMKRRWVDNQAEFQEHLELAQRAQMEARVQARELSEERAAAGTQRARAAYEEALALSGRRPLTPLIVGQSFVAGAKLYPMTPWLAEVFQVDEGVVVWEVIEGTPAHEAGLVGGDVIIRVGGEPVSSLEEVRFGMGYFETPLTIRVIRKGDPVEITIRK